MTPLEQKIAEINARPSRLTTGEVDARRKQIEDFIAISAFEGLHPSPMSMKLQDLFAADKLTPVEYVALCKEHSSELRV